MGRRDRRAGRAAKKDSEAVSPVRASHEERQAKSEQLSTSGGRAFFKRRTLVVLIVLLIPLSYLSYRSVIAYRLRAFAWEASDLRANQRWRALESLAVDWAEWDKASALPLLLAAEGAERQGSTERVAGYLERIPTGDPQAPALLLELATLYFGDLNRPQDGVDTVKRSLELDASNPEAHRRLIFYYGMTMQRLEMIKQTRAAISQNGDSQETYVYLMGANWLNFSNAYELNGKWLRSGQNTETYAVAEALLARGSSNILPEDAEVEDVDADRIKRQEHTKMLQKFLDRYPENIELLAYFLEQASTAGDQDAVGKLLAQVPASAAEDNRVWYYKGWLHSARDELQQAESSYRKALELHPYAWRSQLDLANVLRRLTKFDEVEKWNALSLEGKQIREQVLQLPDVQSVSVSLFRKMQRYAKDCGDELVAQRMDQRLINLEENLGTSL